jgi:DNA-binding transcriptional LysR family regulator
LEAALGISLFDRQPHRLRLTHEIPLQKLSDEAWIFPPREANSVLYDELLSCCHRVGFSPNVTADMTQRPRVISQVACGIGVATLVETLKHLCIGGTTYHRLIRPTPTIDLYLVYRKSHSSGLNLRFLALL